MFGTLRKIASAAMAAVGLIHAPVQVKTPPPPYRYDGAPIPLHRIMRQSGYSFNHSNGGKHPRVKGKKDSSRKVRSNRRKAAR